MNTWLSHFKVLKTKRGLTLWLTFFIIILLSVGLFVGFTYFLQDLTSSCATSPMGDMKREYCGKDGEITFHTWDVVSLPTSLIRAGTITAFPIYEGHKISLGLPWVLPLPITVPLQIDTFTGQQDITWRIFLAKTLFTIIDVIYLIGAAGILAILWTKTRREKIIVILALIFVFKVYFAIIPLGIILLRRYKAH